MRIFANVLNIFQSAFRKEKPHHRSMDELDSQPVRVHYPASTIGYETSTSRRYPASVVGASYPTSTLRSGVVRSSSASEYGGSYYGSTPSLLRVHKAIPVKTKNKKTVYVIDRSNVASEAVVMAPSGRASPT